VAELSLRKAHYAAQALSRHERFEIAHAGPFFKEFVVRDRQGRVESLLEEARAKGYWAGVPLGNWYPELDDCFLVAVTEQRTRAQIDGWVEALAGQNSEIREVVRHA
jgi:glycine dehydrogenase subunit 1